MNAEDSTALATETPADRTARHAALEARWAEIDAWVADPAEHARIVRLAAWLELPRWTPAEAAGVLVSFDPLDPEGDGLPGADTGMEPLPSMTMTAYALLAQPVAEWQRNPPGPLQRILRVRLAEKAARMAELIRVARQNGEIGGSAAVDYVRWAMDAGMSPPWLARPSASPALAALIDTIATREAEPPPFNTVVPEQVQAGQLASPVRQKGLRKDRRAKVPVEDARAAMLARGIELTKGHKKSLARNAKLYPYWSHMLVFTDNLLRGTKASGADFERVAKELREIKLLELDSNEKFSSKTVEGWYVRYIAPGETAAAVLRFRGLGLEEMEEVPAGLPDLTGF